MRAHTFEQTQESSHMRAHTRTRVPPYVSKPMRARNESSGMKVHTRESPYTDTLTLVFSELSSHAGKEGDRTAW